MPWDCPRCHTSNDNNKFYCSKCRQRDPEKNGGKKKPITAGKTGSALNAVLPTVVASRGAPSAAPEIPHDPLLVPCYFLGARTYRSRQSRAVSQARLVVTPVFNPKIAVNRRDPVRVN